LHANALAQSFAAWLRVLKSPKNVQRVVDAFQRRDRIGMSPKCDAMKLQDDGRPPHFTSAV
jgi:hypothetical protein